MKNTKKLYNFIIVVIILFTSSFANAQEKTDVSIYNIQYTTNAGNGTYPSPYLGQIVTTGGIVTGTSYSNGRFFISSSQGGAWNGIYVYNNDYSLNIGDSIIIEAEVYEYNGFTELKDPVSLNVINSGNPLPPATPISTTQAFTEEAYEGVLVEINDVVVTQEYDEYDGWMVDDGSGPCYIYYGFINMANEGAPIMLEYPFSKITGIVTYFWGNYLLEPRSFSDFESAPGSYIISTAPQTVTEAVFEIPVQLSFWGSVQQAGNYNFILEFNPEIIEYTGYNTTSTLSQGGSISVNQPTTGSLEINFTGDFDFINIQDLIKLQFTVVSQGVSNLNFSEFNIDGNTIQYFSLGEINTESNIEPIGDTITVIQKPLINIPAIVVPGEDIEIECVANQNTSGWAAHLVHGNKEIVLSISSSIYDNALGRWKITATAPTPEIFELYDLKISASGIETDVAKNAVNLIPQRKTNFSFVHITDTHLPTHIFYPNPGYLTDSSEMQDLREVINDINIINPEFVLFTGDMVNEGEMEDFEDRRVYSKAQRLLAELDVPVFLTIGNHDVGGWESAPPPQGTARNDWWRFFGWKWLQNPPAAEPYYTQNYSFDYGPLHFIGMEAYDNYDSYMYNIYGETSFTDGQMQWLSENLSNSTADKNVVFYHFDFDGQINLVSMGIDLALWGHTHSNSEDFTPPYNISTAAVCDGNRAYRIINVEGSVLNPASTIYSGTSGEKLNISYSPENNGSHDLVTASISNQQPLDFNSCQLKFIMPKGEYEYIVSNGALTQIDKSGEYAICYVQTDVPLYNSKNVSVEAIYLGVENEATIEASNFVVFPNPFEKDLHISLNIEDNQAGEIEILDLQGNTIAKFDHNQNKTHQIIWDGKDTLGKEVPEGIYIIQLKTGKTTETKKVAKISK